MNVLNKTIILFSSFLFYHNAQATPSLYASCPNQTVIEPEKSSGFYFSEDCKTAYVLPPQWGSMNISSYSSTGNLSAICRSIDAIEETQAHMSQAEEVLAKRILSHSKRIQELDKYLSQGMVPIGSNEDDLVDEMLRLTDQIGEFRQRLMKSHKDHVTRLQYYAQREGGSGQFLLESGHSQLVNQFRETNSGLDIEFRRIPMTQGFLSVLERRYDTELAQVMMPAVLELLVPGAPPILPSLSNLLEEQGTVMTELDGSQGVKIFGDALAGGMTFSQIGACGVDSQTAGVDDFDMDQIRSRVTANAYYEYQTQVERNHSITYNLSELVRVIHEQTRKGGFFSRRTYNSLIDSRRSTSWITFHAESEDTRFEYSDEYIKEIKQEFIDRAIKQVVAIKTGRPASALSLIDPDGISGSDATISELGKCPWLLCKVGASGFRILSATFGSPSAVSKLQQSFKGESHEIVQQRKMVTQVGSMTFK